MDGKYVIGIDVGGQTSKLGVMDTHGNVLGRSRIRTDEHADFDLYIKDLGEAIRSLVKGVGGLDAIRGVGVGAPGGNYKTGTIELATNLRWKGTLKFAEKLRAEIGLPVVITNDANAAAMGEMIYGVARERGIRDFIMITLGTGVGSGIVIDGRVVYGHDGFAGELGHTIRVRENGRACGCGRNGCLETYTSAVGVARTAREILETTDRPSVLRDLPPDRITSKDVAEAAAGGDQVAIDIFNFTGEMLGASLADFVAFSAPQAIILFGGLAEARDLIKKPVEAALNKNVLALWKDKVEILFSGLEGDDAAILGASALAWEL